MSSLNGPQAGNHSQKSQGMRDIQLVLARWGVWARYSSGLDYSSIAAGFKGLLADTSKVRRHVVTMMAWWSMAVLHD